MPPGARSATVSLTPSHVGRQAGLGPRAQRAAQAARRWEGGPAERSEGTDHRLLQLVPVLQLARPVGQPLPVGTPDWPDARASLVLLASWCGGLQDHRIAGRSAAPRPALTRDETALIRDYPFERKDGAIMYFNVSATTAIIDGKRQHIAFFRDVTERKKAEDELKRRERHYRKLWNDAPVAYHILDIRGNVENVNRTEASMLGYEPDEMIGRPIFDFILPEERDNARQHGCR